MKGWSTPEAFEASTPRHTVATAWSAPCPPCICCIHLLHTSIAYVCCIHLTYLASIAHISCIHLLHTSIAYIYCISHTFVVHIYCILHTCMVYPHAGKKPSPLWCAPGLPRRVPSPPAYHYYLTQRISQMVSGSQLPLKIVNSLFTITNHNNQLTIL